MSLSPDVLQELRKMPTSSISDAFDKVGVINAIALGLIPLFPGARIVGTATTCRWVPARTPEGPKMTWEIIENVAKPGDVLCIDAGGVPGRVNTVGGNQCLAAKIKGIAGAVVDGYVRDAEETRQHGFPVFSRGYTSIENNPQRCATVCINQPVVIAGAQVKAGDIIVADEDSVAVIPPEMLNETLKEARRKEEFDTFSVSELRKGTPRKKMLELAAAKGLWKAPGEK